MAYTALATVAGGGYFLFGMGGAAWGAVSTIQDFTIVGYISQRKEVTDLSGSMTPITFAIPTFDTIFTTKGIDCSQNGNILWYDNAICWQHPPYSIQDDITGGNSTGPFMSEAEQMCEKQVKLFETSGEFIGFIGMQAKTTQLYMYAIFSLAAAWAILYLIALIVLYPMKFCCPDTVRKWETGIVMEPSWMCREAFMKLDTDGNGFLEYNDLIKLWESYGLKLSEKELRALFVVGDQAGDGKVSYNEFYHAWTYSDEWRQARQVAADKREREQELASHGPAASNAPELFVDACEVELESDIPSTDPGECDIPSTDPGELTSPTSKSESLKAMIPDVDPGASHASNRASLKDEVQKNADSTAGPGTGSGSGTNEEYKEDAKEFSKPVVKDDLPSKHEYDSEEDEDEDDEEEDDDNSNELQFTDSQDVGVDWSNETEEKFAPVSIWGCLKRFSTVMTARFGRHLGPRVIILAYYTLRFGWKCDGLLWHLIGAGTLIFFLGFLWWTFLFKELSYQTKMVQQGQGHVLTKNTLSATSHFCGGVLRLDKPGCMYWPLLQHAGEVLVGIIMLEFDDIQATGIVLFIYLCTLIFFLCMWPYEDTGGGYDVDNWGSLLKQILLILALACLAADFQLGTCNFDQFGMAYKGLGLLALFVPPIVSKVVAHYTVKSLAFASREYVTDMMEGPASLEIVELDYTASFKAQGSTIQGVTVDLGHSSKVTSAPPFEAQGGITEREV